MINLFFITSPLQLINATEAREHFKTTNNILVVIFTEYESKNRNQISSLINEQEWDNVIRFDLRSKNSKTTFLRQIRLVKSLKKDVYDNIFCGNYSSIGKMILANVKKNKVYLLDDGAVTITQHLIDLGKKNSHKERPFKKKVRQWRFNLFGLKTIPEDTVNLFTSYALAPHGDEEIIYNDLKYFKKTFLKYSTLDEHIYLLGQPLSEIDLISRETYLEYVKKIQMFYNKKIIYIPHRAESLLDDLLQQQNENFIIQEINQPIELEFITSKRYPMHICSFYSSALFTLNILYPESEIVAFEIETNKMVIPRTEINTVYEYIFTNTSIKKIAFRDL